MHWARLRPRRVADRPKKIAPYREPRAGEEGGRKHLGRAVGNPTEVGDCIYQESRPLTGVYDANITVWVKKKPRLQEQPGLPVRL
jgi:hypothetical protein